LVEFHFLENVKEHATLSARAHVDHGVEVECKKGHENRAADRGCVSRLDRLSDSDGCRVAVTAETSDARLREEVLTHFDGSGWRAQV
jgi:hypothetical protein